MSLTDKILRRMERVAPDRRVFTRSDFIDLGSTDAIGMALQRLMKSGRLRRIARGLYHTPTTHPSLGELSASSDAIAAAIARRDALRLGKSEAAAANLLNLSEQVPARAAYRIDRRPRSSQLGQKIEFRQRSPRKMAAARRTSGLIMAALHSLGPRHITAGRLEHLRKSITPRDRRRLIRDIRFAPAWMHQYLRFIAGKGTLR
jgi:predicted transcriptional regulator of viral defense system